MQVELCLCEFGCLVTVYKTCLLLEIIAQSRSLQSAGLCSCPRYACLYKLIYMVEGVWELQSPSGYTECFQGTCWSQLRPGHLLYS